MSCLMPVFEREKRPTLHSESRLLCGGYLLQSTGSRVLFEDSDMGYYVRSAESGDGLPDIRAFVRRGL